MVVSAAERSAIVQVEPLSSGIVTDGMDRLCLIGVSHETADTNFRSSVSLSSEKILRLLIELKDRGAEEALALSTCNRTELVFVGLSPQSVIQLLSRRCGVSPEALSASTYLWRGLDVVRHLFGVASGLKSAAIGENEILGQFKSALQIAREAKMLGRTLEPICQRTLRAAKRIRTESGLGRKGLSLSSAAVRRAVALSHTTQKPHRRSILILGSGQMAQSVAKQLAHRKDEDVTLCSRNRARTQQAAEATGSKTIGWECLSEALGASNIVFCAMSLEKPLLAGDLLDCVRGGSVIVDLGLPANVAPDAKDRHDVKVVAIQELLDEVSRNSLEIANLMPLAESILTEEVEIYAAELCEREAAPCIQALVSQSESIRLQNLEWALAQIPDENARERKLLEDLSIRLTRGMLKKPIENLKNHFHDPSERAVLNRFFEADR